MQSVEVPANLPMLQGMYWGHLSQVAVAVWFLYEILLTIDLEIESVWKARMSLVGILFLVIRYYGFLIVLSNVLITLTVHSPQFCQGWLWFSSFNSLIFMIFALDLLLLVRLYGLYGRNRKVLVGLLALYIFEMVANLTSTALARPIPLVVRNPDGSVQPGCMSGSPGVLRASILAQALCLSRSFLYFGLTLYRSVTFLGDDPNSSPLQIIRRARQNVRLGPLISLILRDDCMFFFMILATQILASVTAYTPSVQKYGGAIFPWVLSSICIFCMRLVLNLKSHFQQTNRVHRISHFAAPSGPTPPGVFELQKTSYLPVEPNTPLQSEAATESMPVMDIAQEHHAW